MKKVKRSIISLVMCVAMISTLCVPAFAVNLGQSNLFEGYQEVIQDEFYQAVAPIAATADSISTKTIIHNGGNPMKSDFFINGQSDGNNLIAVTYIPVNGTIVETAHFTPADSLSESCFTRVISNYEAELSDFEDSLVTASSDSTIKHYQWTFPDPRNDESLASLTTAVTCERKSRNSTVDGVACSVWDVTTFSQLEKEGAIRLNDQYTRLSVDQPNQYLIAYGPSESTSGGDITVGLDGAGVPSFSYTFNIDGFSVEDLSSMRNEYGRWAFIDHIGNESSFTTKPGIRATNSNGDFIVELSHTANFTSTYGNAVDQSTGVIQIYVSDR